jgi:hypothetical protein
MEGEIPMSQSLDVSRLLSLSTQYSSFSCVVTATGAVLDIQARYVVDGRPRRQAALAQMSLCDLRRLRDLLDEALTASERVDDPRQTAMWAPITDRVLNSQMRRGRLS